VISLQQYYGLKIFTANTLWKKSKAWKEPDEASGLVCFEIVLVPMQEFFMTSYTKKKSGCLTSKTAALFFKS